GRGAEDGPRGAPARAGAPPAARACFPECRRAWCRYPRRYVGLDGGKSPVLLVTIVVGFAVGVVQASFFEWTFHRYWLHRPWRPKDVSTAHTLVHHQLCKHDDTFEVHDEEQHEALSFQWWGGPFLILLNLVPWSIAAAVLRASHVAVPWLPF